MTTVRSVLLLAITALTLGACTSASAPSAAPTADPTPSAVAPSGVDPETPVAIDVPPVSGDPGAFDPNGGRIVIPKPGQLDIRPIPAQTLTAEVTGRRVVIVVAFTSGVEPCNVLDSIVVATGPSSVDITLREGHGPEDIACIEIAEFKRALVDLGELQPGTYRITDGAGGAAPISVTIG